MAQIVRIALDAMGGDFGPGVTIAGAALALDRNPDSRFLLVGDETAIREELVKYPRLAGSSEIRHASVAIRMDDKPSQALRQGRRVSSMWMAIEAVKSIVRRARRLSSVLATPMDESCLGGGEVVAE